MKSVFGVFGADSGICLFAVWGGFPFFFNVAKSLPNGRFLATVFLNGIRYIGEITLKRRASEVFRGVVSNKIRTFLLRIPQFLWVCVYVQTFMYICALQYLYATQFETQ